MFSYGAVVSDSTLPHNNKAMCSIKHVVTERRPEYQPPKITFELLIKMDDMLPEQYSSEQYVKAATCIAIEAETTAVIAFVYWALYLGMVRSVRSNLREIAEDLVVRKRNGAYVGTYAIVGMVLRVRSKLES